MGRNGKSFICHRTFVQYIKHGGPHTSHDYNVVVGCTCFNIILSAQLPVSKRLRLKLWSRNPIAFACRSNVFSPTSLSGYHRPTVARVPWPV